jgi:3-isopropylmalate/(R)-2-methylmalate dehydratase small subunit
MEKFESLDAVAALMSIDNIDTDQIIPKQFLKIVHRSALGDKLFFDLRYNEDGSEKMDFVFNQIPYRGAQILVTGNNFGCGSSREHAVWALMDYGVRCVISTGFSDIFAGNSVKNGLLTAVVSEVDRERIMHLLTESPGISLAVDLPSQTISTSSVTIASFEIDKYSKSRLIQGMNEIDLTLQYVDDIALYETRRMILEPWLIPAHLD